MANRKDNSDLEWEEIKATLRAVGERLDAVGERLNAVASGQEETDRQLKVVAKSIKSLRNHVGGQDNRWSRIIESLVAGDLSEMLAQALQIEVNYASMRVKGTYQQRNWEIDVLAVNAGIVVPVEVKTTLKEGDVDYFVARILAKFTYLIPSLKHNKVYGAIAFVKVEGNEDTVVNYALSKGLIVIKAMRGTNHIINPKNQKLRNFSP